MSIAPRRGDPSGEQLSGWPAANQRYLVAALGLLRALLEQDGEEAAELAREALHEVAAELPAPPALEVLAQRFQLSAFERDTLLLCAGVELDAAFAAAVAAVQGDARRAQPTFSLALAVLPEAHWSALGPAAPLRRCQLVELGPGEALTRRPLHIDERVLHYLAGVPHPDERLAALLEPVPLPEELPPSHRVLAGRIVAAWSNQAGRGLPLVQLCGEDRAGKRSVAATAAAALGLRLDVLPAGALAGGADEALLARLLLRETILGGSALLLDGDELDGLDATALPATRRLLERIQGPALLAVRDRMRFAHRTGIALAVRFPTPAEQRALWESVVAAARQSQQAGAQDPEARPLGAPLAGQFSLSVPAIRSACAAALATAPRPERLGEALWDACRAEARPRLEELAQRIEPAAGWDELVLPAPQREMLHQIGVHVRQRSKVYQAWGFEKKGERGLGVSALFSGGSGTGKTMAAEVLAGELRLDLYRIDLSQVVNKYIGETEKNLRRVFDAAE
ncbi:MAG: AAA family ATPase, partial [Deltaproteobacteria bacterium]|nr:AAA family ATPase [Deltaproteobacteria bacterium]